ncbi:MAG: fasciclin domain-containing protein [Haliea sp.]|nr:MAG: fasciclin domain-containing protein [Haliea sp.]
MDHAVGLVDVGDGDGGNTALFIGHGHFAAGGLGHQRAAGLVETLKGPGPFTVFAPTNAAFAALPAGTVDTLLKPENKATLTTVLTYHVVPGKWDAAAITKMISDGKGQATIKTVAGGSLKATAQGGKVMVTDEKGGVATVTIADVYQSNGVIHVVDKVLLPK